jgi:uncharacterized protein (TIGR02996 family)
MTTKDQRETFEKSIEDHPNDPGPHLVFSDWLEEHGYGLEAQRERWLAKIVRRPYDPALRWKYARWLSDHGRDKEARLNFWVVTVLKGKTDYNLILTRRGPVDQKDPEEWGNEDRWPEEVREECQPRANEIFKGHPPALFVVIGDGPPEDNGLSSEGTSRVSVVARSPVLYYDRTGDLLYQVEEVVDVEIGSLCPFCGWDRMEDYDRECPHFVTEITEWPDTYGGTEGGTFRKVADEVMEPLAEAVWSYLSSGGQAKLDVRSEVPADLHPIIEAMSELDEPYIPGIEGDPVKQWFL